MDTSFTKLEETTSDDKNNNNNNNNSKKKNSKLVICGLCQEEVVHYIYMFQLNLEDETGSLSAIVYNQDAVSLNLYPYLYL